jgi:formate hydrogenlyase subunit 3/multisubunit Na+/H+ antiporter MnhD subunit
MALPPLELFSLEGKDCPVAGRSFPVMETSNLQIMFLLLAFPLLAVAYSLPLVFGWIGPNAFYGFRNRRTRANPKNWYAANRTAGIAIIVAMAICVALEFSIPNLRRTQAGHLTSVVIQISAIIIANAWATFRILMRSRSDR